MKKGKLFTAIMAVALLAVAMMVIPAGAQDGGTLVITSTLWSQPAEQTYIINEVIKPFEEMYGVTVKFDVINDGAAVLDRIAVQSETDHVSTDLVIVHNGDMAKWTDAGYVSDISELKASLTDRTFSEAFASSMSVDGKDYFLPISADVYLTIANNDALPYKPADADMDTLTWDQYADWVAAVAAGEGEGKAVTSWGSMVYTFGATGLSYGAGFPDFNSPEAMQAWNVWAKMGNGWIDTVDTVDAEMEPLKNGEAWMAVAHVARVGEVYGFNPTQFTIGPAPSGPAGTGSIAGAHGIGIVEGAPNAEAAKLFIEYLTEPEMIAKTSAGAGGFIPPISEAIQYLGTEPEDVAIAKAILVLENGVTSGVPGSDYTDWGAVKQVYMDTFKAVREGQEITQEFLDGAQANLDALLK